MTNLLNDLRYALRQLRKSPGFAITAILTLALAIGANTAIFSVVNALMLRPLPYPHPDRLGALITQYNSAKISAESDSVDGEMYEMARDRVPAVTVAAYSFPVGVNLQANSAVRYVIAQRVSAKYFDVLGTPPLLGRGFTKEDDLANGPNAAVLSNALWRTAFHSDPHIIGHAILLKGAPYTVVGVLARGEQAPEIDLFGLGATEPAELWTPLRPTRTGEGEGTNYGVLLRLNPGSTWAQANAQLGRLMPTHIRNRMADTPGVHGHMEGIPLQKSEVESTRPAVLGLMMAVGFILLIACANLAGLGMVRAQRRSGEMATRMALGASRWQLVRQLWTENMVLALLGGAAGIGIAAAGLTLLEHLLPPGLLPTDNFSLDGRVLLFTLAVSLTASILAGMLPALALRRVDLRSAMAFGANRAVSGAGNRKTRTLLIAGEIALTVVLVAASGLLIRSLIYLETLPAGFDATNVTAGEVSLDEVRYHDAAAVQHLFTSSLDVMRKIPGVENAAVGLSLPYERGLNDGVKIADGKNEGKQFMATAIYVSPGYFDTLRMHLLAGRDFNAGDTAKSQPVAIVNESFARNYLDQRDAVGRHLGEGVDGSRPKEVVGIVSDVVKTPGIDSTAPLTTEPTLYVPATQIDSKFFAMVHMWFQPSWIVRTRGPIAGITADMQRALADADPTLPFSGFYSMAALEQRDLGMQRVEVILLGVLAGLALLLSAIGVYGLIANLVVQRKREIGIRLALGSSVRAAMLEIGRSGVLATMLGLGVGLGASFLALRALKGFIYGIRMYDPATLIGTALVLAVVAVAATFLPTRRIARIDPTTILREE
jgi:macrolide transport system ATP-binding/permease protein